MRGLGMALAVLALGANGVSPWQPSLASSRDEGAVLAAVQSVRSSEAKTIADQVRLCEVPAPTFRERARGEVVRAMMSAAGLTNVRLDRVGNVLGQRAGASPRPHVVITAHMDTVFPEGTVVKVRRDGSSLRGPGIGDNCRGLAVLVAIARALKAGEVRTGGSITFVATVGEEGLGDLRGVRVLLGETLKGGVDRFVALDGSGDSITNIGVGSRRYRFTFRGTGGHSYNNFGRANAAQALGRAVARIAELKVPSRPKTTFNVGRIGGGTSVNVIPAEAWMEIDLRSSDDAALAALDQSIQNIVNDAVRLENARNQNGPVTVTSERVGTRPTGRTDEKEPIVQTILSISSMLGMTPRPGESSTEANIAMQLGIPAIAIGAGGRGSGSHTLEEAFDTTGSSRGTERALRLAIALASP